MTGLSGCGDVRLALGVYVVGAIDPAERTIVDVHLSHCPACREELAGLAGLPALLGRVPARDVERLAASGATGDLEEPPPELLSSLLRRVAARRRARKWRTITVAAAAAVIAVAGGLAGGAAISHALSSGSVSRQPGFGPNITGIRDWPRNQCPDARHRRRGVSLRGVGDFDARVGQRYSRRDDLRAVGGGHPRPAIDRRGLDRGERPSGPVVPGVDASQWLQDPELPGDGGRKASRHCPSQLTRQRRYCPVTVAPPDGHRGPGMR